MRRLALTAAVAMALLVARAGTPESLDHLDLPRGPQPVGFRSERLFDRTRTYATSDPSSRAGRPIQMLVFFPASASPGPPATFGDYVVADWTGHLAFLPAERRQAEEAAAAAMAEGLPAPLTDSRRRAIFDWPGVARPAAPPREGRFPLVLFEPGLRGRGWLYTPLCEMLASHGYIVASLASLGRTESEPLAFDLAGVETQSADIGFAVDRLAADPAVDATRVAFVGWSVGGVSQALVRVRRGGVAAAVSLDSGTGYEYGAALLREASLLERPLPPTPFLQIDVGAEGRFKVPKDRTFFEAHQTGPGVSLLLPRMKHSDLVTTYALPILTASDGPRRDAVRAGYRAAATYLLRFLDAFVRQDQGARAWLTRGPTGEADPDLTVVTRRGF